MKPLVMVLAMARGGVIGNGMGLPWHIPEDLKHFKTTTMGHAIIMGRKTYDTVGKPLPGRTNIVVSRSKQEIPGSIVVPTIEEAIARAREVDDEPRVIGGAAIYRAALPYATKIILTEIDRDVEGDTVLELDRTGFEEVARRRGEDPTVSYVTLARVSGR